MSVAISCARACKCCARRRVGLARLGQDDDAFGAGGAIGDAKHRNAALADAGDVGDGLLDLLRIEMAAGANDDVLDAAGDVDVAARHVAAVAAVEPTVVEQLAGLGLVAEIAAGRRRSAKLEPSLRGVRRVRGRPRRRCGFRGPAAAGRRPRFQAASDRPAAPARRCRAALSWSRSTRSISGGRPSGGNASPTEYSARP